MKVKIKVTYIFVAVSLIGTYIFYHAYLSNYTKSVLDNFRLLNATELARQENSKLLVKLNTLSASLNYTCLQASYNNRVIYQKSSNLCATTSFSKTATLISEYDKKLQFKMILRLPRPYEFSFLSFIVFQLLIAIIFEVFSRKVEFIKGEEEKKRLKATNDFARQVAHDIRSPLATLDFAISDFDNFDDERKILIKQVASRIHSIANGLLNQKTSSKSLSKVDFIPIIKSVISEKQVQYEEFDIGLKVNSPSATVMADEVELARIISNLINNGVEASIGKKQIAIEVNSAADKLAIIIQDFGKGIPDSVIHKICNSGFSFDKVGGNGLGLHHAKSTVEQWQGAFSIESKEGEGTKVIIELPLSKCTQTRSIVFLDDDPLLRITWEMKARELGVNIFIYETSNDLFAHMDKHPRDAEYYIDSNLAGGERGEDVARKLHELGASNINMATGFEKDQFSNLKFLNSVVGKEFP